MSITPASLLQGAKEIAAFSLEEVHQRNAISRAYYWAYHSVSSAIPPDRVDRGFGMHKNYIAQLISMPNGSFERNLGIRLQSMHGKRIVADYELSENVTSGDWVIQLCRANEVQNILDNPPPSKPTASRPSLRVVK